MCDRRESCCDAESNSSSNNDKARIRRQSLLPVSELHLEVPCFAVKPVAAKLTDSLLCDNSKETGADVLVDHRQMVSIPSATSSSSAAHSDKDGGIRAGDSMNVYLSGELSAVVSGTAASVGTEQSAGENTRHRLVADAAAVNGTRSELPPTQQVRSFATVPYTPSTFNIMESRVRRGRIASLSSVGSVHGRGRLSSSSSAPQPSSTSLACPAAELLK